MDMEDLLTTSWLLHLELFLKKEKREKDERKISFFDRVSMNITVGVQNSFFLINNSFAHPHVHKQVLYYAAVKSEFIWNY